MDEDSFHIKHDFGTMLERLLSTLYACHYPRITLVKLPVQNQAVDDSKGYHHHHIDDKTAGIIGKNCLQNHRGKLCQLEIAVHQILALVCSKDGVRLVIDKVAQHRAEQLPIENQIDYPPGKTCGLEYQRQEKREYHASSKDEAADEPIQIAHDGDGLVDLVLIIIVKRLIEEIGYGGCNTQFCKVEESQ